MVRTRPALPAGHGELTTRPDASEWAALARANHAAAEGWTFTLAGLDARELRTLARAEARDRARTFSAKLGVPLAERGGANGLLVATGHQTELYHPGVWVKDFLLQHLAEELSADAVDLMVDTDTTDTLGVTSPCFTPHVGRCRAYLAVAAAGTPYCDAPVPDAEEIASFAAAAAESLSTLPSPAVRAHFERFADVLARAAGDADNLAELVTIARRRYEANAGTDYLELPLTSLASSEAFSRFVAGLALDARSFAEAYNAELAAYRLASGTRSAAQPVPDLAFDGEAVELPFWALGAGRAAVWARNVGGGVILRADGRELALPGDADAATAILRDAGWRLAPRALALTLFMRLFVADLFIHGIGGGRYDRVTDGIIRRYFGVEPPAYAVASLTMYLPLGAHVVTEAEVAEAKERINRFTHNPDSVLGEAEFDSEGERSRAIELAAEKARLVAAISQDGADRKSLGIAIKAVNAELAALLAPIAEALRSQLELLETQLEASEILTDRTYPFCFWSPEEIADKAR